MKARTIRHRISPIGLGAFALCLAVPPAAFAQVESSPIAIETLVAVDHAAISNASPATGVMFDAVLSADLGRGLQALVRPIAQRRAGVWNSQIWTAALRYERPGPIGLRFDAGLIPAPVGLANLTLRPNLNPTISQPSSLFSGLPAVEFRGPRTNLLGAMYPFGGQATVSGEHWDARVAMIDMSPLRPREVFADVNPPRFTNVVVGGGITPFVGLRLGASVTRGGWRRASEVPGGTADRDATVATIEGEFSFRYTKITGEWIRDDIETERGTAVARGWFIQGQQTLTPRVFVAGRAERIWSSAALATSSVDQHLSSLEETIGYRISREITLRIGHRARKTFTRPGFDHQGAVSLMWWKRWL